MFDPVLDELERGLLAARGCALRPVDEKGRVRAAGSLLFMPHCDRWLYSNALEANWSRDALPRLAILGNSFGAYAAAQSRAACERESAWCRVLRAAPFVTERPCDEDKAAAGIGTGGASAFDHAFNNLALHTFERPLPPQSDAFWVWSVETREECACCGNA